MVPGMLFMMSVHSVSTRSDLIVSRHRSTPVTGGAAGRMASHATEIVDRIDSTKM